MDESQHSSRLRPSMFGKVQLQSQGAMIGSHTLMHLKEKKERSS